MQNLGETIALGCFFEGGLALDFQDVKLATTLAESASLTAAASKLHMSLPAASIRLKNLERKLGAQLFYRTPQGMKTTGAGSRFVEMASRLLAIEQEIEQHFAGERHKRQHMLRIAGNTSYVTDILPSIIGRFQQVHSGVNVDLSCHPNIDILRDIAQGDCDLGFLSATTLDTDLKCFEFGDDPLSLVVPAGSALCSMGPLRLADFHREQMVCLADYGTMTAYLCRQYEEQGHELVMKSRVLDFRTMADYIARGIGVGIMHHSIYQKYRLPGLACLAIAEPWAKHRRYCAINEENPSFDLANSFLAYAIENWSHDEGGAA